MGDSHIPSTAPGAGFRPWHGWLLLSVALIVAAGTAVIINLLRERADECRRVQTELASLHADAQALNALEWETISKQKLDEESSERMEKIQTRMHERFSRLLGLLESTRLQIDEVSKSYRAYVRLVDQEFRLIATAKIEEAEEFDEMKVDPAFNVLETALEETGDAYDKIAVRTLGLVSAGTLLVLLSGVGVIALLVWQFNKKRRLAEAAEQHALRQANETLESRVRERTADLAKTNQTLLAEISERKRTEESLRLLSSAVEQSKESTLITDAELDLPGPKILFVNPAFTKMTGYSAEEAIGKTPRILQGPRTDRTVLIRLRQSLERGEAFEGEAINYRKNGEEFTLEWQIAPIRNDSGKIMHFVAIQRDITERKQVEETLLLAKSAAEAASRAKSEFLANMSHEIRTPMNGIIGMTELVLETELDRVQREYLEMAKSSAHALLGLINNILDFSKIEAGKIELEVISFSLRDCIGTMLKPLGIRADQKGLELTADIPAAVPDHFVGDPMRLRQILINLTDNAIKFTEHGDVMLGVAVESATGDEHCLHFTVSDTGIGIPVAKQALIFDAFAQADGTTTRTYGGTGLGLAIASQLVGQMGGRIWVESTLGEGTTFHFTAHVPVRHTPVPNVLRADPRALEDLSVLVVDDNAVNRRILREMLASWRMQPSVVASGAAAIVEMLRAAHAGTPFPLVILDGMMPEMDGFMVAEKIREHAELSGATVMMLTSAMPTGAIARCGELGVASYLTKPVSKAELLDAILIAIGGAAELEPAADAAPIDRVASGLRILLAEDNVINRALATGILEKRGHSLVHAANGREAVEAAARETFDRIFMDVQMPEMDGIEATRRIRESEEASGRHTTIVAMTAHAMAGDRERCLAAGMDDYVSKPLRKEDLLRALHGAGVEADEDETEMPLLSSRQELLSQCDGDEELMRELVSIFQENTPQIVQAIGEAIEQRDARSVAAHAHKLLISLGAFGAGRARTLALHLEKQGQENDFGGAKERFMKLEHETDKIYDALADFVSVVA
jgi:two-component system sensor histidine kinase/response regulator